jgi:hypothetical protein
MTFCDGIATAPHPLTGTPSDVLFNITGGTAIGLNDQFGVKEIPSFTPETGNALITVTPVSNGCTGTHGIFKIVVRPTPSATISVEPRYARILLPQPGHFQFNTF